MTSTLTSTYSNGQSTTLNSLVCIGIDVSGAEAHLDEEGRKRLEAAEAPLVRGRPVKVARRARLGLVFLLRSRTHKPHTGDGGDRRSGHASFAGRHAKTSDK